MILYTQPGCGKCMILKKMLDTKKIDYTTVIDLQEVTNIAEIIGTTELPILNIDGKFYSGTEAVLKVKEEM